MFIATSEDIHMAQLITWRGALRLEKLGMKRHGVSVRRIAQSYFGMPKATCDQLIDRVNEELSK